MRRAVFWLLFLLVILWMIQGWLLPFYLEKHLLPNLAFRAGLPDFSCPVRHIGLFGLELGPIALGHDDDPALRAATVFVSYSVPELARRQLRDIHISGLKIYLKRHQGKFALGPIPLFPPVLSA
jgi:hypothetical protein